MLVLSRRSREAVVIGAANGIEHLVKVTVLEISGGRVGLGFEAGLDVPVHRADVWERIFESRPSSSNGSLAAPVR
jgi:carbon storage regulator CsrA